VRTFIRGRIGPDRVGSGGGSGKSHTVTECGRSVQERSIGAKERKQRNVADKTRSWVPNEALALGSLGGGQREAAMVLNGLGAKSLPFT